MKVFCSPDSERLLDILTSAFWHYCRHADEVINSERWNNIDGFLEERKLIDKVVKAAVDNPVPGSNFAVRCRDGQESTAVLNSINEPMIAGKCREDVEIIRNHIMQAVH